MRRTLVVQMHKQTVEGEPMTRTSRLVAVAALVTVAVSILVAEPPGGIGPHALRARSEPCRVGYTLLSELQAREHAASGELSLLLDGVDLGPRRDVCINDRHPETLHELAIANGEQANVRLAPGGSVPEGAPAAALDRRDAMAAKPRDESLTHPWEPMGKGPLQSADPGYDSVNGLGLVELAGRITDFFYVPDGDRLYASVATGGVWRSDDEGGSWVSVGDRLPTQVVGSVAYTPEGGGTLLALTGDGSFGSASYEGMGAYWSDDEGQTWHRAEGVPDAAFGFQLAVDASSPSIVYAATGTGLFRSTDAGRTYENVVLPTGECAGKSNRVEGCLYANIVSDVVVRAPGGVGDAEGGAVVAAVGWRAGSRENPDGTVQSPNNGIYASPTGEPGSFAKATAAGFAPQERIGRIELGAAVGDGQNHDYLYAIVQDAVYLRGGAPGIDIQDPTGELPKVPTVLNGIYVSPDFGSTWTKMADSLELQEPQTGSALVGLAQSSGYGPGIQSWYNEWIQPDPTKADPLGTPTRLLFGLEEVWMNEAEAPQVGKSQFKVVGRYFSGDSCLFLGGVPACPTDREDALDATTTTHPDQHAAIFIPQEDGGVTLVVGNDGGVYTQTIAAGGTVLNGEWGVGANEGFHTLFPYHATRAKDGTVWMGLQDNGSAKIQDVEDEEGNVQQQRQIMAFGGDGFFVGVDPDDADIAYSETTFADMRATTDGGRTWSGMAPNVTDAKFSNPFVLDPLDPEHILTAGRQVVETVSGPGTGADGWVQVFDLGTASHPGDASATAAPDDPANSMSAVALHGDNAYVGFCGTCDVLDNPAPFESGLATNVAGAEPPSHMTPAGWHIATAEGLPNRYITSVAIQPDRPETIYVSVGGYQRRWTPAEPSGHVFRSTDAGETFTDISGKLPNTPATSVALRGGQLVVGTDVGVFALTPQSTEVTRTERVCKTVVREGKRVTKCRDEEHTYHRDPYRVDVVGEGMPNVPISTVEIAAWDPNLLTVATYGRGVYEYRFGPEPPPGPPPPPPPPPPDHLGENVAGPYGFEVDEEGWTVTTHSDTMAWKRAGPGNASGFSFQVIPYTDESSTTLSSPELALPERSLVRLSWSDLRNLEDGFDYMSVLWSSDGFKWHAIDQGSFTGMNADFPDWSREQVEFVAPAGKLFIRFQLTSDQPVSAPAYQGIAVDDIVVER